MGLEHRDKLLGSRIGYDMFKITSARTLLTVEMRVYCWIEVQRMRRILKKCLAK